MIDFFYNEIAKTIQLIEFEIERIQKVKQRTSSIAPGMAFNDSDIDKDIMSEEADRYQKEIDLLMSMRDKYQGELNKMPFKFGLAKEYQNQEHRENKQNGAN